MKPLSIDVQRQIRYWADGAREELETCELLFKHGKLNQGLFWSHLTLEKAIKALVVKKTHEVPPFSHDLVKLAKLAEIPLDEENTKLLDEWTKFSIHGRYQIPNKLLKPKSEIPKARKMFKEMLSWLLSLL